MCGGMGELPARRVIYVERTEDLGLAGRLRAIADRLQGNAYDSLTASAMADTCEEEGAVRSTAYWRGYAAEMRVPTPEEWPVRQCPACGIEVLPAAVGVLRINCPACDPFTVRKAAPADAEAIAWMTGGVGPA